MMQARKFLASFILMFVVFNICSQSTAPAANQKKPFLNQYFTQDYYRELAVAKVGSLLVKGTFNCLFRCVAEPPCLSVNLAAHPDSDGLYQCDLLATDKYRATAEDFQASDAFHHYSPWPMSPCDNHSCHSESACVPDLGENKYRCKCQPGSVGIHCDRRGKSCSEIKSFSPEASSGSYAIDPDGEGGCEPIIVFCNMTENYGIGVTVIGHDSENRTLVKGYPGRGDYSRTVHYSEVKSSCISQLANLTAVSSQCEQFIKYECYHSRLLYNENPYGWWVSRDHEEMKYWGGAGPANSYKCACGVTQQCADRSDGCNCDKNDYVSREDSGFLREKSHLPVIELRFGDTGASNERGYHTLGKLKCYGTI
ncbi:contactin-associated protein-like 2 [Acropora palmata]|uniref:contactin-associated protein-like 2 n=1 Tax=Acropora palmata TaxID=6131 RepID=UPI003DA02D81